MWAHPHEEGRKRNICVCVCVNINCLCCSMGTAVDCVVLCGHDLFVSVVLINVGMLYACVHVCSRAGTFHLFVQVLGGVWSSIKNPGFTCHCTSLCSCHSISCVCIFL